MNEQQPEKPDHQTDGSLDWHSAWHTLQGEGPSAGRPAVFVRLAGCNLQCPACDTDYTIGRERVSYKEAIARIGLIHEPPYLVVITGGEPFRQNLDPLVTQLIEKGYEVHIETNGTLPPTVPIQHRPAVLVICSPKVGLNPKMTRRVDVFKYVIRAGEVDPDDGLPTKGMGMRGPPARPTAAKFQRVFVQPLDEGDSEANEKNIQAAVQSCLEHGYRLSLQIHKIVGLD